MHRLSLSLLAVAMTLSLAACKPAVNTPAEATPATDAATTPEAATPASATGKLMAMRAFGNEPFWEMTDKGDGTLEFSTPDKPDGGSFAVTRSDDASGIHYAGNEVKLDIAKQDCSDGMSDAVHAFTATMVLKGTTYKGCAAPASAVMPAEDGGVAEGATAAAAAGEEGAVTRFKANGFSPAWRAEVDGKTVKLDVPEHGRVDPGFTTVSAERSAYSKGVEFSGKDAGVDFTLNIDGRVRCDKASDENGKMGREFSATLQYGKTTYKGCADAVK